MEAGTDTTSGAARTLGARDTLVVGVTLFSMFFGAGNLILAPLLGVQAAAKTPLALAGFLISAVGLPVLTIAAIALSGSVRRMLDRVHPLFSEVFTALVYLAIGPFLAIPRTATTSFEMIRPLLPASVGQGTALVVFSIAFFAVAYLLAMRPNKLTVLMGRASGPSLILLIVVVVGACIVSPPGTAAPVVTGPYVSNPLVSGFVCGYQTMDVLAALAFGIVVAGNIRAMGVADDTSVARQVAVSGVLAGVLLAAIYLGFGYLGYSMGSVVPDAANGAVVIAAAAATEFGAPGALIVAAIFLLACLNVCIGLICSISEYFAQSYPVLTYRRWVLAATLVSLALSNFGLDAILGYSVPLLSALYPVAICVVAMGLSGKRGPAAAVAWRACVAACGVCSLTVAVRDGFFPGAWVPTDLLPLADIGMAWLVPAVVALVVGWVVERALQASRAC